jgi:hypothetical protein
MEIEMVHQEPIGREEKILQRMAYMRFFLISWFSRVNHSYNGCSNASKRNACTTAYIATSCSETEVALLAKGSTGKKVEGMK